MDNTLSTEQTKAFRKIIKRINNGERYTTLKGYAGTGKTFLVAELFKELFYKENRNVYITAPTHKAAQVLGEKIGSETVKTIHSFLGLILRHNNKGGYTLVRHPNRCAPSDCIVFLDECSMIGPSLWRHIEETRGVTWVFVGDPAQLPPVNEAESPTFDFSGYELNTIVRQAKGNPIIDLAWKIRNGEKYLKSAPFTTDKEAFLDFAVDDFKFMGKEARVLTYHNVVSDRYNDHIRAAIYGDIKDRFVEGEWIVARDTWSFEREIRLYNSEELEIQSVSEDEISTYERDWRVWRLTASSDTFTDLGLRDLYVLHESEREEFDQTLESLRTDAIFDSSLWWKYYRLKESFAHVDYLYSMTVHRAQGSTFKSVYVDHEDLLACCGPERAALVYVAVTRPSERLLLYV